MRKHFQLLLAILIASVGCKAMGNEVHTDTSSASPMQTVWQIGAADGRPDGMALAPDKFADFLPQDFGWEDKFFLIGYSDAQKDWPYVLPGPADGFGGTGGTSGVRLPKIAVILLSSP